MPTSSSSAAEHARRLDRALLELRGRGADPDRPPRSVLRALARAGLRLRPPYYYPLAGACAHYALLLTPFAGAVAWLLVWRHDAVRPLSLLSSSVQMGLVLGVAAGILSWLVARLRRLSRWHEL